MEIAIVIYDGFDDLDALGPHEVFSHASEKGATVKTGLYTLGGQEQVESSHGVRIEPDGVLPANPDIVTAGGITAGIDLALWLVEREFGADIADAVSKTMEYDRRGEIVRES